MSTCVACAHEIHPDARFCAACGMAVDVSEGATLERPPSPSPRPASDPDRDFVSHGRFVPGTVLGARYRIVEMLGKGGMGEVYRADDLKLGQAVALKFLPKRLAADPSRLARLLNEVRIARQVSHPNVCRVYDVGEVDGEHFISMEYIRGEDLADLLRRIGRLPSDKVVQIARQICNGLAAAHARGVLHRDLKPGNVLLDEHGVARLTDFGLAGLAEELRGAQVREGTPAYMAPEQLAGREVSVRSDIYSLGLVLYELFTGQSPFRARTLPELIQERESSAPVSPSSLVALDPIVERVILRCMETQPARRPASALAVAASLPGGNPLAEALAAGETPSPEMVAAAGENEGLSAGVALAALGGVLVALVLLVAFGSRLSLLGRVPLELPPDTLAGKARELVRQLGYTAPPTGRAHGFQVDAEYMRYVRERDSSPSRWSRLDRLQPPAIVYWYRQSPRYLSTSDYFSPGFAGGVVTFDDPPHALSEMVGVKLDPRGRLVFLQALPPQVDDAAATESEPDWDALFAAAGLDPAHFRSVAPTWTPLAYADARAAWEGSYADRPDVPLRVEAASYRGRPVSFALVGPWTRPSRMQPFPPKEGERVTQVFLATILLCLLVGSVVVARRNLRLGRGDRRGAARLGLFVVAVTLVSWVLGTDHVPTISELGLFIIGLAWALSFAVLIWLLYHAIEPYVRRRWPNALISWSRALAGSFRDPLVGRDLLLGALMGVTLNLVYGLGAEWLYARLGLAAPLPPQTNLRMLMGPRYLFSEALSVVPWAILVALSVTFLLFLLRIFFRREWLAGAVFILALGVPSFSMSEHPWIAVPVSMALWAATVLLLVRFGLLAVASQSLVQELLGGSPLTRDLSAWYAGPSLTIVLLVLALAGFGFYASLGGRPLLREELLEA
jgi:serine/threonine-protein kinase